MEETVIVIMLKDKETGFLEKELGCYTIEEKEELIYNTYALEEEDGYLVVMNLTCGKDVLDWEYSAIFDYYDTLSILPFVKSVEEDLSQYNPAWKITFDFSIDERSMEEKIAKILLTHYEELQSVILAIAEKRDDYIEKEE